jgi:cyclophilin family peptidyl-prolyl cis-trans isomerase/HEAT repeat protein
MCTAAVLVLILSGCPKTATTASPAPAIAVEDATIGKLARILRASDRRIVDDDLRALAKDSDASIREKAVLALGQIADPSSLAALDAAGTDAEAGVRASAAFAMGLIADRASEASLERLAADASSGVRAAAAEALGRVHEPGGAAAIQTLLEDADPQVHAAAGLAAWKFAEPEPLLASLIAGLSSTDGHVRMACSYALARLASVGSAPASSGAPVGHLSESGVTQAKTALTSHVADPDPEVRMNVARGLASPRAGSELAVVGTLSKDPVPGVRVNAARALGYPGISIKPYLENATADKDPAVIRTALEAVGAAGGGGAVSVLNDLVPKLENGWLREAALLALAKADPSKTPDIVAGLLANPDPRLRAAAATLVAGHREALAIRAALALLADPVPSVKALGAPLVASQDGPVSNLLAGFFKFPDPVVRAAVSEVVGDRFANRHHDVESPDDLFARLEEIWASSTSDGIPDAKLAVVDAAAKAGKDDRSKAVFTRALADPDVIVRRRAAVRLREVYGEDRSGEVGPASTRSLADYERIVKWSRVPHAAVVSLQRPGTAVGRFTIALDSAAAPMAAWNFAELAAKGFFDGASVHRVVPNFVVQDGDPRGDGFGGPGYSIRDEFNPLTFSAGVLGMASDGKDTAGSQWFITLSPQPHLDGRYTTFGRVVRGFREIVTQIRPGDTVVSIRVYEGTGVEPFPN